MDDANILPNDLDQCQRLLLAAFKQSVQLEQQVAVVVRRVSVRLRFRHGRFQVASPGLV